MCYGLLEALRTGCVRVRVRVRGGEGEGEMVRW